MKFAKLQATGNDFIFIDADEEHNWSPLAKAMCHRHLGIGADGLIVLLPSKVADLRMRLYNPDGSEAEACGNGLRCLARYAIDRGLVDARELVVETLGGMRKVRSHGNLIQVDMGKPKFKADEIPMLIEEELDIILDYPIIVQGKKLLLTCLSMGNPHAVCFLDEPIANFPLAELGPVMENHPLFPDRINFEVANVLSRKPTEKLEKIEARVWERGVGETLSCGTGACAVAVVARLHDRVAGDVDIILPGGVLTVDWDGVGEVMLRGPAEMVFQGEWPD
ncbi:MAG: diaminopimelate epimerase [Dehalococcoidia bacterium]|nr:MAG: diaminopimelate epimerase [Dehalococcoidia bacterium]